MNLVEKILARASGKDSVRPGDVVVADVDRLVMHDLSAYLTSKVYEDRIGTELPYPDRVVTVFDHHFSPPTEHQADVLNLNREWSRRRGTRLFDCGSGNIHNVLMQNGLALPGQIVVGSDSHTPVHGTVGALAVALGNDSHAGTVMPFGKAWFRVPELVQIELSGDLRPGTTPRDVALWLVKELGEGSVIYKALEFTGPFIKNLDFWDRWLFPVLSVDLGAKCAYIEPDEVTRQFVKTLPGSTLDGLVNGDGDPVDDVRRFEDVRGSASLIHDATVLYASAAGGWRNAAQSVPVNADESRFYYVQLGVSRQWLASGKTTFYVDRGVYKNFNVGEILSISPDKDEVPWGTLVDTEVRRWGLGLEQAVDAANLLLYAQAHFYDPSIAGFPCTFDKDPKVCGGDPSQTSKLPAASWQGVVVGARIQF